MTDFIVAISLNKDGASTYLKMISLKMSSKTLLEL